MESNERVKTGFGSLKVTPFGHLIGVAEHKGQIVGHMALIPTYMKIGEEATVGS